MEKRYIEANALKAHAIALNNPHELGEKVVTVSDIEDAPTADVVEVVRCKDCVNRRTTRCQMYWESDDHKEQYSWENDNEFCSEGCRATAQEGAEQ